MAGQPMTQQFTSGGSTALQMDKQTQILWDFLETAFRTGTLDKVIELASIAAGKDMEDMSKAFDSLEDIFLDMEDTAAMEEKFDVIYQAMEALTDDDIMDGLGTLVSIVIPIVRLMKMQTGNEDLLDPDKMDEMKAKAGNVFKALGAVSTTGVKMYMTSLGGKSAREYGQELGKALNQFTTLSNDISSGVAGGASGLMAGVFDAIDGDALRRMTDSMTDGFMAQRPPIIRFAASTAIRIAKNRLLKK